MDLGRARDRLVDRQASAVERDADPSHHVVLEMARARPPGVFERDAKTAPPGPGARRGRAPGTGRLGQREGAVVACLLQHGQRILEIGEEPLRWRRGVGQKQRQVGRERHPRRQPGVAERRGDGGRLRQQLRGRRRPHPGKPAPRRASGRARSAPAPREGAARSRDPAATPPRPCRGGRTPPFPRGRDARPPERPAGRRRHRCSRPRAGAHGLVEVVARGQIDVPATLDASRASRSCSSARRRFVRLPYATSRMRL